MARILKTEAPAKEAPRRSGSKAVREDDLDEVPAEDFLSDATAIPDARTIVHNANRAAIATNLENRVQHLNRAASELLGHPHDDVIGRNLLRITKAHDIFGNRLRDEHCAFYQMVQMGEAPESFELDLLDSANNKTRVAVSVVVVIAQTAALSSFVYLMTPLRRRRRADEAIDRLLAQGRSEVRAAGSGFEKEEGDDLLLTRRQLEVLRLLAVGRSSREIAAELSISVHTVRSHVQRAFKTLGVSNRIEAVTTAQKNRLL
jgi:DNA-binding CsgD family transcriptional regulator